MSQPDREGAPCAQPGTAQTFPARALLLFSASASTFRVLQTRASQAWPLDRGKVAPGGWRSVLSLAVSPQCNPEGLTPNSSPLLGSSAGGTVLPAACRLTTRPGR